jgi:hypothetical protein
MNPCLIRAGASILGAALVLGACEPGVVDPNAADPRLQTSVVADATWHRLARATFSYSVPPGFVDLALQPIDSDAVTFALGNSSLHHDFGWYTGPWSADQHHGGPLSDVVEQSVRIGGRTAQLVSYRAGGVWVVRAWWGKVRTSGGQEDDLLLQGETDDFRVRSLLLASIYSVRFE